MFSVDFTRIVMTVSQVNIALIEALNMKNNWMDVMPVSLHCAYE